MATPPPRRTRSPAAAPAPPLPPLPPAPPSASGAAPPASFTSAHADDVVLTPQQVEPMRPLGVGFRETALPEDDAYTGQLRAMDWSQLKAEKEKHCELDTPKGATVRIVIKSAANAATSQILPVVSKTSLNCKPNLVLLGCRHIIQCCGARGELRARDGGNSHNGGNSSGTPVDIMGDLPDADARQMVLALLPHGSRLSLLREWSLENASVVFSPAGLRTAAAAGAGGGQADARGTSDSVGGGGGAARGGNSGGGNSGGGGAAAWVAKIAAAAAAAAANNNNNNNQKPRRNLGKHPNPAARAVTHGGTTTEAQAQADRAAALARRGYIDTLGAPFDPLTHCMACLELLASCSCSTAAREPLNCYKAGVGTTACCLCGGAGGLEPGYLVEPEMLSCRCRHRHHIDDVRRTVYAVPDPGRPGHAKTVALAPRARLLRARRRRGARRFQCAANELTGDYALALELAPLTSRRCEAWYETYAAAIHDNAPHDRAKQLGDQASERAVSRGEEEQALQRFRARAASAEAASAAERAASTGAAGEGEDGMDYEGEREEEEEEEDDDDDSENSSDEDDDDEQLRVSALSQRAPRSRRHPAAYGPSDTIDPRTVAAAAAAINERASLDWACNVLKAAARVPDLWRAAALYGPQHRLLLERYPELEPAQQLAGSLSRLCRAAEPLVALFGGGDLLRCREDHVLFSNIMAVRALKWSRSLGVNALLRGDVGTGDAAAAAAAAPKCPTDLRAAASHARRLQDDGAHWARCPVNAALGNATCPAPFLGSGLREAGGVRFWACVSCGVELPELPGGGTKLPAFLRNVDATERTCTGRLLFRGFTAWKQNRDGQKAAARGRKEAGWVAFATVLRGYGHA